MFNISLSLSLSLTHATAVADNKDKQNTTFFMKSSGGAASLALSVPLRQGLSVSMNDSLLQLSEYYIMELFNILLYIMEIYYKIYKLRQKFNSCTLISDTNFTQILNIYINQAEHGFLMIRTLVQTYR